LVRTTAATAMSKIATGTRTQCPPHRRRRVGWGACAGGW